MLVTSGVSISRLSDLIKLKRDSVPGGTWTRCVFLFTWEPLEKLIRPVPCSVCNGIIEENWSRCRSPFPIHFSLIYKYHFYNCNCYPHSNHGCWRSLDTSVTVVCGLSPQPSCLPHFLSSIWHTELRTWDLRLDPWLKLLDIRICGLNENIDCVLPVKSWRIQKNCTSATLLFSALNLSDWIEFTQVLNISKTLYIQQVLSNIITFPTTCSIVVIGLLKSLHISIDASPSMYFLVFGFCLVKKISK